MEELNQVQDVVTEGNENVESTDELVIKDDEGLFDDWSESDDTPVEEETTETDNQVEETPIESTSPYELKIKFNGEEKSLNEEEARILAQKGMNYDRFYEPLERLARQNNMSVGDFINSLNETQMQYEVAKEVEALREDPKYEGVSDEVLEEIATNRVNENVYLQDKNYEESQREIADAQQAQIKNEVDKFLDEYPEFKDKGADSLDPQVFEYVKQGYTLLEAFNKWSRQQANKPQEIAKEKNSKLNEENKERSLGNTTNAGSTEVDNFMSGFLNG